MPGTTDATVAVGKALRLMAKESAWSSLRRIAKRAGGAVANMVRKPPKKTFSDEDLDVSDEAMERAAQRLDPDVQMKKLDNLNKWKKSVRGLRYGTQTNSLEDLPKKALVTPAPVDFGDTEKADKKRKARQKLRAPRQPREDKRVELPKRKRKTPEPKPEPKQEARQKLRKARRPEQEDERVKLPQRKRPPKPEIHMVGKGKASKDAPKKHKVPWGTRCPIGSRRNLKTGECDEGLSAAQPRKKKEDMEKVTPIRRAHRRAERDLAASMTRDEIVAALLAAADALDGGPPETEEEPWIERDQRDRWAR